jgi:hypothetical protein
MMPDIEGIIRWSIPRHGNHHGLEDWLAYQERTPRRRLVVARRCHCDAAACPACRLNASRGVVYSGIFLSLVYVGVAATCSR